MLIDVKKFAGHLRDNADKSGYGHGKCAYFVRQALKAGNVKPATWPVDAKDWGPTLLRAGFHEIPVDDIALFKPQRGDVAIIQATTNRTSGHIQGFDGINWTSDFVQAHGFWPGPEYRTEKPAYVIYRP